MPDRPVRPGQAEAFPRSPVGGEGAPAGPGIRGEDPYVRAGRRFDQEVGTIVESSVQAWQRCIDSCHRCAQACEECLTSCLKEPDVDARLRCIQLLRDCADICALSARYMARGSQFAPELCRLCATICDACGAECARFQDQHCQDCARHCRECADECRRMAGQAAGR